MYEQHCKPGSVSDDHLSWLYVTAQLLCPVTRTERDQPGSTTGRRIASYSVLLRVEFTQPCLLPAKRWALTPPFHHHRTTEVAGCFFSIALVLESPPPDVIRHPALWSPDFPHQLKKLARPSVLLFGILTWFFSFVNKKFLFTQLWHVDRNFFLNLCSISAILEQYNWTKRIGCNVPRLAL